MPVLAQCVTRAMSGIGHGQEIVAGEHPATRFAAPRARRALLQQLAAAAVVLAWPTRWMRQGRLKIRSQRQALLPSAQPRVGLCRWRIRRIQHVLDRPGRWCAVPARC